MRKENAIARYEDMMLHGTRLTLNGTDKEKEQAALDIIRYVITEGLRWTPEEAMDCLNEQSAKAFKLDKLINKYIHFPSDVIKGKDYEYVVHLAFPDKVKYDPMRTILDMYRRVLHEKQDRLPKRYFVGNDGEYRAGVLLLFAINMNIPQQASDTKELYALFADTSKANKYLREWKLFGVSRCLYYSPLEYLHYSLPESEVNDFLFNYYSFKNIFENQKTILKRQKKMEQKRKLAATGATK